MFNINKNIKIRIFLTDKALQFFEFLKLLFSVHLKTIFSKFYISL